MRGTICHDCLIVPASLLRQVFEDVVSGKPNATSLAAHLRGQIELLGPIIKASSFPPIPLLHQRLHLKMVQLMDTTDA